MGLQLDDHNPPTVFHSGKPAPKHPPKSAGDPDRLPVPSESPAVKTREKNRISPAVHRDSLGLVPCLPRDTVNYV